MPDQRPNIILIMTDQQRGDCLGAAGHPVLETPHLDDIATQGSRFTGAYTPCPSCVPARRSILSGQYPATHGMPGMTGGMEWNPPATLPGELSNAGYHTYFVGRTMHQHPPRKRFGYDHMVLGGTRQLFGDYDDEMLRSGGPRDGVSSAGMGANSFDARPWHRDESQHPVNWTVDQALRFFETHDPSCPFFLTVSFFAPHPPLIPPPFYMQRYLDRDMPAPVIGDWVDWTQDGPLPLTSDRVNLTGESLRRCQAGYFGLIDYLDDQIHRILDARLGQAYDKNNTAVIFTSDHGEMLGDHHYFRKCEPYEGSARIPLLIGGGADLGFKQGQVCDQPATLEDLMPTCLDLAGVDIPDSVDGQSLVPLLRGQGTLDREYIHGEHAPQYSQAQAHHYLTDNRFKYIWRPLDGTEQLFDLTNDREERHDLSDDPTHAQRLSQWRQRLIEKLQDRPEGFTDGQRLIPGQDYPKVMAHARSDG